MNKKVITFLMIISCFFLSGCGKKEQATTNQDKKNVDIVENKKITIIDEESKSRPYAVVINNYPSAVKVQTGLQEAYMIYEFPIEGGMSRSLALYKDKDNVKIGTIRSARHDYLDYVIENDAIFVHFGWSVTAKEQMSQLGIENINGLYDSPFWRENPEGLASEHTVYTNLSDIIKYNNENKQYRTTTDVKQPLKYTTKEVDLSQKEDAIVANNVEIPYSDTYNVTFKYDEQNKYYNRFVNGVAHTDYFNNNQFHCKNIIVVLLDWGYVTDHVDAAGSNYLDLDNTGKGSGYYITNGYAKKINWEKNDRSAKTIYTYDDGSEVDINDGNTWIMFQSLNKNTLMN